MALSNTAVPKYYGEFRDAVIRGEIPVCKEIEMEMNRIDDLIANPGMYYDDLAVEGFISYSSLYNHVMNDTNITDGGYVGSKMYTEGLEQAKTAFKAAFGDMVLTHRDYLTNAVTDGHPSAGAWFDSEVELMNEIMVYGTNVYAVMGNGSMVPNNYTTGKQQFAAPMLNPSILNRRFWFWLRDVVSSAGFALVNRAGYADYCNASHSGGVRPYAVIGG